MTAPPTDPAGSLHVLHVGSGFRPLRWGGLVAYVEDLTAEQARRGARVSYLFSGRYFRWPKAPRLKRWRQGSVEMLEIVNSPLSDHGRQPELEVSEPAVERLFMDQLADLRPDIVHVQELAGIPSSILDIVADAGVPMVMTLQDYFPLCSNFKLLDADGNVCLKREIGVECAASVAGDGRRSNLLFEGTLRHELMRRQPLKALPPGTREALVDRLARSPLTRPPRASGGAVVPAAFQRRRDLNVARLNRVDRVIAMSTRVAEIYSLLGVEDSRLATMPLTLSHIDGLTPRQPSGRRPVTFATLGGGESVAKGSRLLLQAARSLGERADPGSFRLLVFGQCEPEFAAAADSLDGVEMRGIYRPEQLDAMLDEVDVGLMPSIWEEAYGYAGIEFIAKGIPVIANRIGGMVDYVRDGETGWLNRDNSGRELTKIMLGLAADPVQVAQVAASTRAARGELVTSMPDHASAIEAVYRELLGR